MKIKIKTVFSGGYRLLLVIAVVLVGASDLFAWVPEKTPVTNFEVWPLKYTVISNEGLTVSVTGLKGDFSEEVLDIPAQVEYDKLTYTVTEISEDIFTVEDGSFKIIYIPATVNSIEIATYRYNSRNIEEVNIASDNMDYTSIDGVVYDKDVSKLLMYPPGKKGEVNIPETVSALGPFSFAYCGQLDSLVIPKNVISIETSAFYKSSLRNIKLPETLEFLGSCAFASTQLESLYIPDSVYSIGAAVCEFCNSLIEVRFPENENLKVLHGPVWACPALKAVHIPSSVERLDDISFFGCKSLEYINIPASLVEIGRSAFEDCPSLTNFDIDENNPEFVFENGMLLNKDKTKLISYPSATGEVEIPDGIEVIGWAAFGYCPVERLTLPASVKTIEGWAFNFCNRLEALILLSPTPPWLNATAITGEMGDYYYRIFNIFVPNEYLEAYKEMWWEKNIENVHIYGLDRLAGVDGASIDGDSAYTVYSLNGIRILDGGSKDELKSLPNGLYIVNGKKTLLQRGR